jgi:ribosomal protein L16
MQLVPKRTKFRKMQKGNNRGTAYRGSNVDFGDFAMQATEPGRLTGRQIEAARMAITRHVKRVGKLWIRIFPHRPVTKKPLEVRSERRSERGEGCSSQGCRPRHEASVACTAPGRRQRKGLTNEGEGSA